MFSVSCFNLRLQAQFELQSKEGAERIIASAHSALHLDELEIPERPHTLENFAKDHFVPPAARTIGRSGVRREKNVVWSFQKVHICFKHFIFLATINVSCQKRPIKSASIEVVVYCHYEIMVAEYLFFFKQVEENHN